MFTGLGCLPYFKKPMKTKLISTMGALLGCAALTSHAQSALPGAPDDNGVTPKGPTTYINVPPDFVNNGQLESLGVAIANNGNIIVGWEDDGDGISDLEGVWTLLNSSGEPITQETNIVSNATGEEAPSRLLSYFRTDGTPIPPNGSWGPKIKANLFGDGIGMGSTSFTGGPGESGFNNEITEYANFGDGGDFPTVQLLNNDGQPLGIVAGVTDAYADHPGDIRIGDWDYLSNGNIVIAGESRQSDDLVDLYGGESPQTHVIYRVVGPTGTEVKAVDIASSVPDKSEMWHGAAVTKNGFALRFALNGAGTIRLFNNDGTPASTNIDLATLATNSIVAAGGRGDSIGFQGNGKDAYVLATYGFDDVSGLNQAWITVLNTNGTIRYTKAVSDDIPPLAVKSIDAAIDASGRVVVAYADAGSTGGANIILGRAFDPAGNPLGGTFYVSENELPDPNTPDAGGVRVAFRGDLVAIVWESNSSAAGLPTTAVRTFSLFKPGTLESVGLTRIVPDTPVIVPDADSLGNWEPYASVLGTSTFLIEGNTFAQGDTEWQRFVVAAQPVDGRPAKLLEGFYADNGTPYNTRINGSRENGNPGRVAGDKRPGAVNYMVGAETSIQAIPAFQSDNRWTQGFAYGGTALLDSPDPSIDRFATVQTFKLDPSTLTATPLMKAADSANGRQTSGEPNHGEESRFGGELAALDNGNFVSVVEDRSGIRTDGHSAVATIFAPDGTVVKDSWVVAEGDIWSNVAAYKGGFAVRVAGIIYFFDNSGTLKGQVDEAASGEIFSRDRGDGTRLAAHINSPFVFLAGQVSGANLIELAAFDSRDQSFAGKTVVSEPAFAGGFDRANLAVDALNRITVGWTSQPTGYELQQVAVRVFSFDATTKTFTPLTASFLPFINAAPTGGIHSFQMNLAMTTKQILVAAKGEINLENKPDQGANSPKEINFYTVFSSPDPKDDPTAPADGSTGGDGVMTVARAGANISITWTGSGFTLQSSSAIGGTWTPVTTTGNSYSAAIAGQNMFFRLKK
jgi:hypothetical protein